MKQKIFAICDMEEAYALRMAEYMLEKIRLPYALHLFTKVEELEKFMEEEEIAILLIAESALELLRAEYVREQVMQMFILQENDMCESGPPKREQQGDDRPALYISKFQSPETIVAMLIESAEGLSDWRRTGEATGTEVKLIGIYSPVKRCLQTTFALTMGQMLSKEHRVLYFNFECYSGFGQLLGREFLADVTDVMYYFRCDKEKLALHLPAIIQNINGLDYVPPMQSQTELWETDGRQWLELCRNIASIGEYEYIILDLDDGMSGLFDLLKECYKIYTITRDDSFAVAKLNQYEQILKFYELEEVAERTVKCRFPIFKEVPVNLELMTHGELAGYVKAIIREDLYGK